jgi:molybdenum cofactor guanylyltransferase
MTTETDIPSRAVSLAILAGGKSTRFGEDKALARFGHPPRTLLQTVIERVSGLSDDLFIVSEERPGYADYGVPVRPDLLGKTGVLGALGASLSHARHPCCLVVSCDMPFLNRALLSWMIRQNFSTDALIPRTRGTSRQGGSSIWHFLHGIYRKECLTAVKSSLQSDQRSLMSLVDRMTIQPVEEQVVRRFDPTLSTFMSVNTNEDYLQLIRLKVEKE